VFKENFGFDFADLAERHSRVATKVRRDPELLRRSMTFLGITGEVICPAFENAPALADRVFLRPSWLVDVMKELVRHDLREHLQALDSATMSNAAQIRSLGQQFLSTGVLDRQLRPWLWRELQPTIVHDEAQMDFLVELMEHFGLLVAVPGSEPRREEHSQAFSYGWSWRRMLMPKWRRWLRQSSPLLTHRLSLATPCATDARLRIAKLMQSSLGVRATATGSTGSK
jgi:hypothetical protein